MGFEPAVFGLTGRHVNHYTTPPTWSELYHNFDPSSNLEKAHTPPSRTERNKVRQREYALVRAPIAGNGRDFQSCRKDWNRTSSSGVYARATRCVVVYRPRLLDSWPTRGRRSRTREYFIVGK
jgi:hypothetical protein